ncbi:response regulator [Uliginosibacterium sp. H1]|uniref:response regulator n=1 Tax=Uliginosibacterium sp. H1 TaxID=3114757 RepID=UPI002E19DCF7|nr:response regulator [Uliginosibacterium sp. H1]
MADVSQVNTKPEREYCSTSEAAQMLGVSLGTVQQMVENGLLDAWKTAGGHRRIRITSVEAFLRKRQAGPVHVGGAVSLRVLIAEDDRIMQALYERTLANWELPIEVKIVASGFEGLMEIGRNPPDLLVSDLVMPGLDGFAMIRKLRSEPALAQMDVVVVTGLTPEDIDEQGGLPDDVIIYGKPIPFKELKGYVQAKLVSLQKRSRA